jgi:hypothetical protein
MAAIFTWARSLTVHVFTAAASLINVLLAFKSYFPQKRPLPRGEITSTGSRFDESLSAVNYSQKLFLGLQTIVKQLDSLSTSEWLEVDVSNECIPKVGARLYTNRLHQTYIMWNSCAAWWNKFGGTEWHVRHGSAWWNTNTTLHTILVILYDTLFIP